MGLGQHLARFLIAGGYQLKEINPIETERKRLKKAHPDKSDPLDALAIAKTLIAEFDKLPSKGEANELYLAIHDLSNRRDSLIKEQTCVKNKVHALLHKEYPQYQRLFKNTFSKAALAFWERFPTPSDIKGTGLERLAKFLRDHSNHTVSTKRAKEILSLIDKEQFCSVLNLSHRTLIRGLIRHLRFLQEEIFKIETELRPLVMATGLKLHTMTGIDIATSASYLPME